MSIPTADENRFSEGQVVTGLAETDRTLIDQCLAGDTSQFDVLVHRYQASAYRYALRRTRSEHEAQSLTTEAFTRAYRGLPNFNGRSTFWTWYFRILINLCNTHQRRKARESEHLYSGETDIQNRPSAAASPVENALDRETAERIRLAVEQLPNRLRDAWVLFAVEGQSLKEIAETLDATPGAVKSRLFQARKRLQKYLAPYLEGQR